MVRSVISVDVECPWCGAEPGKPCTEMRNDRIVYIYNRGHFARLKQVGDTPHG